MKAETWEEGAATAAHDILDTEPFLSDPLAAITVAIDSMHLEQTWSVEAFCLVGSTALKAYAAHGQRHDALHGVLDVVISKQYDYGTGNILWGGVPGILLRMHDKLSRIENLQRRDTPANEALDDSWLDLVGYSIVAIMLLEGTFELPMEADIPLVEAMPLAMETLGSDLIGDPGINDAFRQFAAGSTLPPGVTREEDDRYTIEGGGTIIVQPEPDQSGTTVLITDGVGGTLSIQARHGRLNLTGNDLFCNSQRLAVLLCMLLGGAEAALDWRNTNIQAEVPRD